MGENLNSSNFEITGIIILLNETFSDKCFSGKDRNSDNIIISEINFYILHPKIYFNWLPLTLKFRNRFSSTAIIDMIIINPTVLFKMHRIHYLSLYRMRNMH